MNNLPIEILRYDSNNKLAFYKNHFNKWLFVNSDTASVEYKEIKKSDRLFYTIFNFSEDNNQNKDSRPVEFCSTYAGIKLNEIDFINSEIKNYNFYLETAKNMTERPHYLTSKEKYIILINDYLTFLNNRKIILEKYPYLLQTYFIDKPDFITSNNKYCKGACYGVLKDYKELSLKIGSIQIEYYRLKEKTISDDKKEKLKTLNFLNKRYLKDLKNLLNEVCYYLATKENNFLETPSNVEILSDLLLHIDEHTINLSLYWNYPTIEAFEKYKNSEAFKCNTEILSMTENEYLKYLYNDFDKPFLRIHADENLTISLEFLKDFAIYRKLEKRNKELIKHIENLILELNPPAPEPIKKAESKKPKEPTDPAIAVFIYCILQANLHKQPKRINNKKYCFEVLNKYSLNSKTGKGTMKVKLTKEFDFIKLNNKVRIPKHLKDCKELVLPKLDTRTKEKVLFELEKLEPIKSKQNILK